MVETDVFGVRFDRSTFLFCFFIGSHRARRDLVVRKVEK